MPTTLIITNDFPPRVGGIESFVADVTEFLDRDVIVYTSSAAGSTTLDRCLDFEVVRAGPVLLPTRRATREAIGLLHRSGASRVLFGAAAPLGLMARSLRAAGAQHIVALSHGHETWWATVPGARSLLHRLADDLDHLTTISDFAAGRIKPALSADARARMIRLAPPVDTDRFYPSADNGRFYPSADNGEFYPSADNGRFYPSADNGDGRPARCIAVGRFVARKGFGTLIDAWRLVLAGWNGAQPTPELVLVGDGPHRPRLEAAITAQNLSGSVRIMGAVPRADVIPQLQQADVFALPVRTRLGGLDPEGLGLVFLEAAACGLPLVVGDSGGAPETVLDGRTGYVVDPDDRQAIAARLTRLLSDRALARSMGNEGRHFVAATFGAVRARQTLRAALALH